MSEAFMFAFSLIDTGAILFLLVYFVITLSDLECDYLNARQCCSKLNFWTIPRLAAHGILLPCFLLYGHWLLFLINLPVVTWLAYQIFTVPKGNSGVYEPTEIHNRGLLKRHLRDCMIFLGWYLLTFFLYLYCMITALLKGDPLEKPPLNVPEY